MTLPSKKDLATVSVITIEAEVSPWPLLHQDKQAQRLQSLHLGHVLLTLC